MLKSVHFITLCKSGTYKTAAIKLLCSLRIAIWWCYSYTRARDCSSPWNPIRLYRASKLCSLIDLVTLYPPAKFQLNRTFGFWDINIHILKLMTSSGHAHFWWRHTVSSSDSPYHQKPACKVASQSLCRLEVMAVCIMSRYTGFSRCKCTRANWGKFGYKFGEFRSCVTF